MSSPAPARERAAHDAPAIPATVPELHEQARVAGGGGYLAHSVQGRWISAPAEVAGLVLAGPRAGKTGCAGIPALIDHPGAAVSTSTRPEVFIATFHARRALGRVSFFDLTGNAQLPRARVLALVAVAARR